jgi:hypothetical protein
MKSHFFSLLIAAFAMIGLSTALSAQCPNGGCGGSSAGGGSTGCPTGSCPNAGGGYKGVASKPNGGGGVARGPVAVEPEGVPAWEHPSTDIVESAATDERPIIIYFPSENADDSEFYGKEIAELSKADAVFVKVTYTEDREASPYASDSAVPTSKLLSDNPAREYNAPVGKACVVVCDWFGNEFYRTEPTVKADKLSTMIGDVKAKVEDMNNKLQKNLDKAKSYVDAADRKNALKMLLKNFNEGVVGISAQEDSIRLYHEVMDSVRAEIAQLAEKGDAEGLKSLAKEVKKTDAEKDVEAALAKLN